MTKQKYSLICTHCGSDNVKWDAWATWNPETQQIFCITYRCLIPPGTTLSIDHVSKFIDKCRAGYTPPTEKEMEKEILESNPVLKETNFQSKMDKWNKLKAEADKKGLTADQSAKYIADRM